MATEIIVETSIRAPLLRHLRGLVASLEPTFTIGVGRSFTARGLPSAIVLQGPLEIDATRSRLARFRTGVEPGYALYAEIAKGGPGSVTASLEALPNVSRGGLYGFWVRVNQGIRLPSGVDLRPGQGYVFLCPERIDQRGSELAGELIERPTDDLRTVFMTVVFFHEMGHHFTLINLSERSFSWLLEHNDLNLADGLANCLVATRGGKVERWITAHLATEQDLRYRYYHALRFADLSTILHPLMVADDVPRAVHEFALTVGGKVDINGNRFSIRTAAKGLLIDWSGTGGMIMVGERLQNLGPFYGAVVIAARIERLLGRFPPSTVVITNKIDEHPDYGRLPANVKILSPAAFDIRGAIAQLPDDGMETFVRETFSRYGSVTDAPPRPSQVSEG